ncbi:hypothetical protein FB451DRAFT_1163017 [Mycena latifolia]|nr:hypothetical protein FB451DRAFT_1163017 [Mycena latifolia]
MTSITQVVAGLKRTLGGKGDKVRAFGQTYIRRQWRRALLGCINAEKEELFGEGFIIPPLNDLIAQIPYSGLRPQRRSAHGAPTTAPTSPRVNVKGQPREQKRTIMVWAAVEAHSNVSGTSGSISGRSQPEDNTQGQPRVNNLTPKGVTTPSRDGVVRSPAFELRTRGDRGQAETGFARWVVQEVEERNALAWQRSIKQLVASGRQWTFEHRQASTWDDITMRSLWSPQAGAGFSRQCTSCNQASIRRWRPNGEGGEVADDSTPPKGRAAHKGALGEILVAARAAGATITNVFRRSAS